MCLHFLCLFCAASCVIINDDSFPMCDVGESFPVPSPFSLLSTFPFLPPVPVNYLRSLGSYFKDHKGDEQSKVKTDGISAF